MIMLPSGFEPESSAREAEMIGRTTLRELIRNSTSKIKPFLNLGPTGVIVKNTSFQTNPLKKGFIVEKHIFSNVSVFH